MNLPMELDPLLDHRISAGQRPTFPPHSPPSAGWTQTPSWQSTRGHPEHTARQYDDQRSSTSAHRTRTEVPSYQPASHSVNAGHREAVQTGHLYPVSTPAGRSDPVAVTRTSTPFLFFASSTRSHEGTASPTRLRGEWWDPLDAQKFQCQWTTRGTQCGALIAGDRRSVTSHLRDRHGDFSSDGTTIPCGWVGCTASMQRRNIPRHILACHLEVKVPCPRCGMYLSRADANRKHQQACPGA